MTLRVLRAKLQEWRRTPSAWVITVLAILAPLAGLIVIFIVFDVRGPDDIRAQLGWTAPPARS
jgi:hypothetical protein